MKDENRKTTGIVYTTGNPVLHLEKANIYGTKNFIRYIHIELPEYGLKTDLSKRKPREANKMTALLLDNGTTGMLGASDCDSLDIVCPFLRAIDDRRCELSASADMAKCFIL